MGRTYTVNSGSIALSASATKSLILLNPTITFCVTEVGISFDSSASSAAVTVDLYRTTTLGAPAGTTATFVKENANADSSSSNATASSLVNLSAEPTAVEVIRSFFVQPFGGLVVLQFPLGREPQMTGTTTQRLGLRVTTPGAVTPNVRSWFAIEE
ncbi:hypothetical protein [Pseudonocardia sp. T1-2H]|uniref:hypothetical protein n=1 Tax=Pseudonocardia sp. T1-2H TaxID=3128899 RepID=UPI0031017BF0